MSESDSVATDPEEPTECRGEGDSFPRSHFTMTKRFGLVHTTGVEPPHTVFGDPVPRSELDAPEAPEPHNYGGGGGDGGGGGIIMIPDADADDPYNA